MSERVMGEATAKLIDLLDLEQLDTDLFRGQQPETIRQRVYGGQVAAQALIAATRTVDEGLQVHSLHSYFLLPGDYNVPIIYDVERIRDGKSFATRRVLARQHGRPIYYQSLNFQRAEEGLEHQDVMPEVKSPDEGINLLDLNQTSATSYASLTHGSQADDPLIAGEVHHHQDRCHRCTAVVDPGHPQQCQLVVRTAIGQYLPGPQDGDVPPRPAKRPTSGLRTDQLRADLGQRGPAFGQ